jgi:hypothetical protein
MHRVAITPRHSFRSVAKATVFFLTAHYDTEQSTRDRDGSILAHHNICSRIIACIVLVEEAGGAQDRGSAMSRQINLPQGNWAGDASHGPYRIPEGGSHPTRPSLSFPNSWNTSFKAVGRRPGAGGGVFSLSLKDGFGRENCSPMNQERPQVDA